MRGFPQFVQAMMRPDFYPEVPAKVELRQTHVSFIFLAGDRIYKVKKPVRFPFLDCANLERRYSLCADEVRLNSRLSPDVYLGVFPIFRSGENFALGPKVEKAHPEAVDYAVKMRRLPEERMLDRLVSRGFVDASAMCSLAERVARFHASVPCNLANAYGSAAALRDSMAAEVSENTQFVGQTLLQSQLDTIDAFFKRFVTSHWELLERRTRDGFVREGHGDLRAEHICLTDGHIEVIDCVEFSERFRYCDVASEVAFLAMDLERLKAPSLAEQLVEAYSEFTRDDDLRLLLPFYKCYRASIRGKVESLRSLQEEVGNVGREQPRQFARDYFALACGYARFSAPALIVICGISATGKSTVARMIQHRTGFEIINSDIVRKRLAGVSPYQSMASPYGSGIYTDEFSRLTYARLLEEAATGLRASRGVIVDATFKRAEDRSEALAVGAKAKVPVIFIECIVSKEQAIQRLNARAERADQEVSDATVRVYELQRREFEAIREIPVRYHVVIDTGRAPELVASDVDSALKRLCSDR